MEGGTCPGWILISCSTAQPRERIIRRLRESIGAWDQSIRQSAGLQLVGSDVAVENSVDISC